MSDSGQNLKDVRCKCSMKSKKESCKCASDVIPSRTIKGELSVQDHGGSSTSIPIVSPSPLPDYAKNVSASLPLAGESSINLLPDDVIYLIIRYLAPKDLLNLCCVNKHFNLLANKDSVWHHHANRLAIVRFPSHSYKRDCTAKELCRIASHWKHGKFKDRFATKQRGRHIPWIEKDGPDIWFSSGSVIRHFQLLPNGYLNERKDKSLHGMPEDATRFVLKNNMVISGCRDGGVYSWSKDGNQLFAYRNLHSSDVQCLDATDQVIITGSRDAKCKVVKLQVSERLGEVVQSFDTVERVWSLQIAPCQRQFAAGLAGDVVPVLLWDIESGKSVGRLGEDHRRGAGVLDVQYQSPHEVLTCGYDTFLRLWDLRTLTCVSQWEEPHDSALYVVVSDGNNTMAVGTARHGMVRLWDKRQTEPIQAYYSHQSTSPVYSLAMDFGHLFLALDVGLNVMDFTQTSHAAKPPRNRYHQGPRHKRHYR